jgi:hypothetical protein
MEQIEILEKVFDQRLTDLSSTFLNMLNMLENDKLFVSQKELNKYRTEYLAEIISQNLRDDREKYIRQLSYQISDLKS